MRSGVIAAGSWFFPRSARTAQRRQPQHGDPEGRCSSCPGRGHRWMRAAAEKAKPPSLVPAGTSSRPSVRAELLAAQTRAGIPAQSKSRSFFQTACMMTASLRATATVAPTQADPHHQCVPPASQRAVGYLARENGICRLEQIGAQKPVAAFGDVPRAIDIARIGSGGGQAQISTDGAGSSEPFRIVDDGDIGERDDHSRTHVILPISLHY